MAEFILETNYPSEKGKSSRYKSGVQPNFGPKFVSSVSTSTRRAARQRQEVKMNLAPKFLRCIICPRWMISINSAIFYITPACSFELPEKLPTVFLTLTEPKEKKHTLRLTYLRIFTF